MKPFLPALLIAAALLHPALARCIDAPASEAPPPVAAEDLHGGATADPRSVLRAMVHEARERSQAIGAARLLAEAAELEIGEAQAAGDPRAVLTGTLGPSTNRVGGLSESGTRFNAAVNVGAPLYDAGRVRELTDWRRQLSEAARFGQISLAEQVSLQTVSLALERSRYRLQEQVYRQYARKMACLVEALNEIVEADKGRASELVQARKTLQQVELSASQTRSAMRQVEAQLKRLVGPELPAAAGVAAVIAEVPSIGDLLAEAERASDIGQLNAQAAALDSYARAVDAAGKPQLAWNLTGSKALGAGTHASSLGVAVTLSVPLFDPGVRYTTEAARRRAEAARLQAAEALDARRARIVELHEQATAAFVRAGDVADILKSSDRVRSDTLQQWRQIGRRSLFDVMSAESDHYGLRIAYVNALHDAEQSTALLWSLGLGVSSRLE